MHDTQIHDNPNYNITFKIFIHVIPVLTQLIKYAWKSNLFKSASVQCFYTSLQIIALLTWHTYVTQAVSLVVHEDSLNHPHCFCQHMQSTFGFKCKVIHITFLIQKIFSNKFGLWLHLARRADNVRFMLFWHLISSRYQCSIGQFSFEGYIWLVMI